MLKLGLEPLLVVDKMLSLSLGNFLEVNFGVATFQVANLDSIHLCKIECVKINLINND